MSEIVCLLFYRATITLTRNTIPHYRWRISHATLPISSNYELDNGLVASVGFLMYTHPRTGDRIRTCDPRVKSQNNLLFISVAGNLNTLLYLTELRRLHCRGRRNRTSANGTKSINICCKLPVLDASKNTSCCHYTIPQKLWPFSTSAPFPPNLRRYELNGHLFVLQDSNLCLPLPCERAVRYTKPILRSIVPNHYSPCTGFLFGIFQRHLLTLCRCFRNLLERDIGIEPTLFLLGGEMPYH